MLRIRDIMTAEVTVVSPETTVREAMELFARERISGAPVVSGQTVLGVVTTSDLLAFASTLGHFVSPHTDSIAEVEWEAPELPDVDDDDGDESASAFFSDLWDDGDDDVSGRMAASEASLPDELDEHDVSEVMTRAVWSLPSNASASDAADLMRTHGIHRVLVVHDGTLVGIVSALDVANAVADRVLTTRTFVFNRDPYAERGRGG